MRLRQRVFDFFKTRGQSLLDEVAAQREAASEAMDFEAAAALHKHWDKVRAAALLADELIRPVDQLRVLILQQAAPREDQSRTEDAAVFLLERGHIAGPERLSTLGVRAVREQTAVGSSLFAQPLMLAPVPLDPSPTDLSSQPDSAHFVDAVEKSAAPATALTPEHRARAVIEALSDRIQPADMAELCDSLSLFRRWYYRPEKQRNGEVFLPDADRSWPIRRILNGAARVVLGPPTPAQAIEREAAREAAKILKTKIIHAGREGVEREVPILPKRPRTRKAITPSDLTE
jgi:excinuclease ABC subunit C